MSPLAGVDERLAFCEKEGLWRMPKGAPKGRRCTICQHPQRPNIDLAIATGISRRLIAARFKVSADLAWRKTTAEMLRVVCGPADPTAVAASSAAAARSSIRCGKPSATRDR